MCHSRGSNRKINRLHKRRLRITYTNKLLPFNVLLEKEKKIALYQFVFETSKFLATEIYKVSNELSTPIMKDIFPINQHSSALRHNSQFSGGLLKTVYYSTKIILNQKYGIGY